MSDRSQRLWARVVVCSIVAAGCHSGTPRSSPGTCAGGAPASPDEIASWKQARSPALTISKVDGGARVLELDGDQLCRVDCMAPHQLHWSAPGAPVACTDRPAVDPAVRRTADLEAARVAHGGSNEICMNPPCTGGGGDDDDAPPPPRRHPVPPLFGIELSAGADALAGDVSGEVHDAGQPILGGADPVVVRSGALYGVWDHQQGSTEDFEAGLRGYRGQVQGNESLAIFITPELLSRLATAPGTTAQVTPASPSDLIAVTRSTCQFGVCPLTYDATSRLHPTLSGGAVTVTGPDVESFDVDPGSVVCVVLLGGGLFPFVGDCLATWLTGDVSHAFDELPKQFDLGSLTVKATYVRITSIDNWAIVFGVTLG